jgi:hypothetical protein
MYNTKKNIVPGLMLFTLLCISFFFAPQATYSQDVKVIELRNYLIRPNQRDNYIKAFETNLVDTLNLMGNYVLGQYRVKDAKDNFVWIRGFDDMSSRKEALQKFFGSEFWTRNQSIPVKYLVNYMNVYLLRPYDIFSNKKDSLIAFKGEWFGKPNGIAVIDFYIANDRLPQMINFIKSKYDSILRAAGVKDISYWVSEPAPNNYPDLPAFQDKNLFLSISLFKDEREYNLISKKIDASMSSELKHEMLGIVTTKTSWILYPTNKPIYSISK